MFSLHIIVKEYKTEKSRELYKLKFIPMKTNDEINESYKHDEIVYSDISFRKSDVMFFIENIKEELIENGMSVLNNFIEPKFDKINKIPYHINHTFKNSICLVNDDENTFDLLCDLLFKIVSKYQGFYKFLCIPKEEKLSDYIYDFEENEEEYDYY
jgi:hypothetical protein